MKKVTSQTKPEEKEDVWEAKRGKTRGLAKHARTVSLVLRSRHRPVQRRRGINLTPDTE